jgi:fatty-acyl-CoA synthase
MKDALLHQGSTYVDLVLQGLGRFPEREAVVDAGGMRLTYAELETRIWRFAAVLRELGLAPGDAIAQLTTNRTDAFVTMVAALASNIRYTPLHPMGSLEDQLYILADAEIDALVVDVPYFADRGDQLRQGASGDLKVLTLGEAEFGSNLVAAAEAVEPLKDPALPGYDDIAWVTYTGGTTGKPKGVVHTQGSMAATALVSLAEWQWSQPVKYLASSPISHAAGFLVVPTLLQGGTVYLIPAFDPDAVLDLVEREGVNTLFLVPTMIYVLMDHPRTESADLSNLESIIYASAPMSPTRLREALHLFGPVMMQCYGQTESIHLTLMRKEEHDVRHLDRLASCGRPPAGMVLAILNEAGEPVERGEIGEVCVRGASVMHGYWKQPETTAETLRGGWLHTGDLGYQDNEGFLFLVDRAKDMIISGGFNVYPKEVEDVLTSHPAVAQSAVIGVPDEKWGEKVAAIVVCRPEARVSAEELISLVKERKGAVQAPKIVEFAENLPITALGKTDKKALRKAYWGERERMVN